MHPVSSVPPSPPAAAVLKKVVEGQGTGHRLLASQNDTGLRGILADTIGDHLIAGARFDDGALLNGRAGGQTSGLRGVMP